MWLLKMKTTLLVLGALSAVAFGRPGFGPGEQEWGYVTVRPQAHMFWWLYYTTADVNNFAERPLVLWLQGGPGGSSTGYGNFEELGPLDVDLQPRNHSWVKNMNVLFVDNPVGSGFSFVDSPSALTRDNRQIAQDLLVLLRGFYKALPVFGSVPLYIFGQSYGGKMGIDFALLLDQAIKDKTITSNLKGVAMGNSWISPIDSVLHWGPFLYHTGMIDCDGYNNVQKVANSTFEALQSQNYLEATKRYRHTQIAIFSATHAIDFYNILTKQTTPKQNPKNTLEGESEEYQIAYPASFKSSDNKLHKVMNNLVKEALRLEKHWFEFSPAVHNALSEDFMKPVTESVELALNKTDLKVIVYSGQLDLIVSTSGTVKWVDNMNWIGKTEYEAARREPLVADDMIEGYIKSAKNFYMCWINRAGHSSPADNPKALEAVLRLITDNYSGKNEE